ncbi:uncharacterized protein LOC123411927 isoform X2 [Hordeum vulgare subsp. vulgare]|uniref:uncharacterized protein LOC123411927 isoform X2 n=1 Tax=Hordeum vulgare subsp. vulgare TaxID=112509 RepID=UPI001D1A4E71|nr:uncharacterized protein LOC123411927 isoform X2 [Hordeum vulgare subsp. vulgare]
MEAAARANEHERDPEWRRPLKKTNGVDPELGFGKDHAAGRLPPPPLRRHAPAPIFPRGAVSVSFSNGRWRWALPIERLREESPLVMEIPLDDIRRPQMRTRARSSQGAGAHGQHLRHRPPKRPLENGSSSTSVTTNGVDPLDLGKIMPSSGFLLRRRAAAPQRPSYQREKHGRAVRPRRLGLVLQWCRWALPIERLREESPLVMEIPLDDIRRPQMRTRARSSQGAGAHGQHLCHRPPKFSLM